MASNNETTTKFKVDISELKSAMSEAKRQIAVANSEFKAVSSSMDDWSKTTDGISAKLKQLSSNLSSQKTVLSSLEKQYELTVAEMGEGSAQADKLKIAINNQKAVINGTQKEIDKYDKALDEVGNSEGEAGDDTEDLGKDLNKLAKEVDNTKEGFTVFKGVLANLATEGIKAVGEGCKKVVGALADMAKASVTAYADYEQLTGGVETLFKESSSQVMAYANNAYKSAGMSANEYMTTVTGFSASLLASLNGDTAKSAEVADMAIQDMADNSNKMGTSLESIQNAYAGFSKGQYNMLDNLKLGYGGTKSEMERLLKDAEKFSGVKYDINNLSDVYNAIHVIQGELDITGTTAKEASSTITGSVSAMKSAYENLLAGLGDEDADLEQLAQNLADSAITALGNLLPRVTQILGGIGKVIEGLAPVITKELPKLVSQILPVAISALSTLVKSLLSALTSMLPTLISSLLQILNELINLLTDPELIQAVIDGAIQLLLGIVEAIPVIITKLTEAIPTVIQSLTEALSNPDNIAKILTASIDILIAIVKAIPVIVVELGKALPQIVTAIIEACKQIKPKLIKIYSEIWAKLQEWGAQVIAKAKEVGREFVAKVIDFIKELPTKMSDWLVQAISKVTTWAGNMRDKAKEAGKNFIDNVIEFIKNLPSKIADYLTQAISKATAFITDFKAKAREAGEKFFNTLVDNIKGLPEKVKTIGQDIITNMWDGINDKIQWLKDKIAGFVGDVKGWLKKFFGGGDEDTPNTDSIANNLDGARGSLSATNTGVGLDSAKSSGTVTNYTQNIYSPTALSRLDIYRQSKNLLGYMGG